jgi:hypothetical protein
MREVSGWKVDKGGGEVASFSGAVKFALETVVAYNARVFFSNVTQTQIDDLVNIIFTRKGHMSLYAVTDALESLIQKEPPCDLETYGFDAKAIMQALDRYWAKAKADYYEWKQLQEVKEHHDFKPGDPVPEYITVLREKMENRFGVVYDEESSREAMRVAAEKYRREHEQDATIDFS